jgi:hypothetical protein
MRNLLLIGRWRTVTRDQETSIRRQVEEAGPGQLVFVIAAIEKT